MQIQVNILENFKYTQSSLGAYQPKFGWYGGVVWYQAKNRTDIYKARPTLNISTTPPLPIIPGLSLYPTKLEPQVLILT